MRWAWIVGGLHGLVGSAILFLSFHPLRDMLDAPALELARAGSALQAIQGLTLMLLAGASQSQWAAILIAAGTTAWTAMLYTIIFTGQHPLDEVVPIGGMIMLIGWLALIVLAPKTP
ncbi:MAG: DUF423 domain-containing protein [Alphaproteobacteria bacterium]|nr:DUF423 domain-containing protein [Alphaproteobacteria bacterium]